MTIHKILLIFFVSVLSACAQEVTPINTSLQPVEITVNDTDKAWYAARFSFNWEQGQEPDWYLGTLIAGEVIVPLLPQYADQITCWRVHRRAAAGDQAGHVFSFIFYSSKASAANIYQSIQSDGLLLQLQKQHKLIMISYDSVKPKTMTNLADTSDSVWPETVRQSWPYFMMGASQMWLTQVQDFKQEMQNIHELEQRYKIIQSKLSSLWQKQGDRVLLHHLSALYAYQPVQIRF